MTIGAAPEPTPTEQLRTEISRNRGLVLASVAREARLNAAFLMLVGLSTALATIGLLMDSVPVVIGAMLVSPLLGPIMGLGFGLAIFETELMGRSLRTLIVGAGVAILVSLLLTAFSPIREVTPSILARTRPSLFDLLVAIFGGIAGAWAIIQRDKFGIVGVAIATALIPPLATVGYGMATGRADFVSGALMLFVTNTTAIALMGTVTARICGFGNSLSPRQTRIQTVTVFVALGLLAIPLGVSLAGIAREAQSQVAVRNTVQEIAGPDARIDTLDIEYGSPARIETVVISPRYVPDFEDRLRLSAERTLRSDVETHVVQLRAGNEMSDAAAQARAARFAASELQTRQAERIAAALKSQFNLDTSSILIDTHGQRVIAILPPSKLAGDGISPEAALGPLRAAFPEWSIETLSASSSNQASPAP